MSTEAEGQIPDWKAAYLAACANLPDKVEVPYSSTPEGQRLAAFRRICPPEFYKKIDRALLPALESFDRVVNWEGKFPGPLCVGTTDTAKTRAAWAVLGRLSVKQNIPFAWFPVRKLCAELAQYEAKGCSEEFFRHYSHFPVLMVDDLDKVNADFESLSVTLFAFYDWVYRNQRPCITTTNKPRRWWAEKMGDAFARRLFDDAHFEVKF